MLVLSRKLNQTIQIGPNIVIRVVALGLNAVRIGIEAPRDVPVVRDDAAKRPIEMAAAG